MKIVIEFCLLVFAVSRNINTNVLALVDKSVPLIKDVSIVQHTDKGGEVIKKPEFWNNTIDNEKSVIANKHWELRVTCRASYPVEWITTSNIDTNRTIQVRERKVNRHRLGNYFVSSLEHPLLSSCRIKCIRTGNHTVASSIFVFVKDTRPNASVFTDSTEYDKQTDPKIIPCGVTNPNVTATLVTNGYVLYDAKYDPRIGFMLPPNEDVSEQQLFQCRAGKYFFNHKISSLTILLSEPEAHKVSAFENQTIHFVCKSNKNVTTKLPVDDFHISTHRVSANYVTISVSGRKGQKGKILCTSDGETKTWDLTIYGTPRIYYNNVSQDTHEVRCEVSGSDSPNLTSIYCRNKNTCNINKKCLNDGKCSQLLKFSKGKSSYEKEAILVQPPSSGLVQCSLQGAKEIKEIFLGLDGAYYFDVEDAAENALVNLEITPALDSNFYSDIEVRIVCKSIAFEFLPVFLIVEMLHNGQNKTFTEEDYEEYDPYELYRIDGEPNVNIFGVSVKLTTETKQIVCQAAWIDSSEWYSVSKQIKVIEPKWPQVKAWSIPSTLILGETCQLICEAFGLPEPNVTWETNATGDFNTTIYKKDGTLQLIITFSKLDNTHEGQYVCNASNRLGYDEETLYIKVEGITPLSLITDDQLVFYGIIIGGSTAFLILILLGLGIYLFIRRKKKDTQIRTLTDEEVAQFVKGSPDLIKDYANVHENSQYLPYSKEHEIPINFLEIDRSDILGSGVFGVVIKGKYKDNPVAVKMTKPNVDVDYFKALLSELKIMIYIGHHPNVVTFIGSYTVHIKNRILYVIVEHCSKGNLHSYLRKVEKELTHAYNTGSIKSFSKLNTITEKIKSSESDFRLRAIKWSRNISDGMNYLADKKVIHGDLSARNVLLDSNDLAKVTDFGLSRTLYDCSNCKEKSQAPRTWRWMAVESLSDSQFSSKSDVWSFGVTLWELYSLGKVPFTGRSWAPDFHESLKKGTRMKKPKYANCEIYELMCQCWSIIPENRPTFRDISDLFLQLLDEVHDN